MVVFSPARPSPPAAAAQQRARVEQLAVRAAHAGDDLAGHRIDDVADGVHGDDGRDDEPVRQLDGGRADAGLHRSAALASTPGLADRRTGASADVAFRHRRFGRRASGAIAAVRVRANLRVRRRTRDRTGSRPERSERRRRCRPGSRCSVRRATSSRRTRRRGRRRCRPTAMMALTIWTLLTGSSRSVSRVPGAPPRSSTLPVVPSLKRIDGASRRPLGEREVADLDAFDGGQRVVVCGGLGKRDGRGIGFRGLRCPRQTRRWRASRLRGRVTTA